MFLTKKFLFNSSLLCLFSVKSFAVTEMPFFGNWLEFSSEAELAKFYSRTGDNFIKITNDLTGFDARLNQDLSKYFWGAKYIPFIGGQYEDYTYQSIKANMPIFSNLDDIRKQVYFVNKNDGTSTIFANLEEDEADVNTAPLWDFATLITYDMFYSHLSNPFYGVLHYDTFGMTEEEGLNITNSIILVNDSMKFYEANNSIVDFSDENASLSSITLKNSYMNSNIANGANIENLSVENSYVDGNYSGYGEINAINSVFTGDLKGYSKANFNNVISSGLIWGIDELIATNSKLSNIEEVKSLNLSNSIYQIDITKNTFQPLFVSENTSGDNNTLEFLNVVSNNVINYDYFKDQMQLAILAKGVNNISETFFNNFIAYQDDLITLNVDRNYIATNNTASELIYYINNPVKNSIPATKIEDTAIKTPIENTLPSEETNANPSIDASNASNQGIPATKIEDTATKNPISIPVTKIEDTAIKTPIENTLPSEDVKVDSPSVDEAVIPSNKAEDNITPNDNLKDEIVYNDLDTDVIDYNADNGFNITLSDEEIRELSKLSDEELKAFGFTRSEIDEKLKEIDNKTIAFNDIIKPTLNDKTSLKLDELNAFLNLNFYDISTLNKRAINLRNSKVLNGVWTRGSGARTTYNKQFAFKSNDFYLGADRLNNLNNYDLYLGAFLSASYKYSSTKGFIKQNGFGGGFYATLLSDSFYLDAIFSYTNIKNQLNDNVLGDLKAKNNLYKLSFESGYKFGDKYYYEPSLKLNLAYSDKLNFKNSVLSLNKDSKLFANIEARMNFGASLNEYINTNLALGYSYDLTKLSDLDIDIYGLKFAKNNKKDKKFLVNFGTSFNITNNLMIIVDYEQSFSGIYNTSHNINSSFRYTF